MSEKKANQPLMIRRDYDTPEAMMFKPMTPEQYTPEEMVEESAKAAVPSTPKGFKLICPACEEANEYIPEEDVAASAVLVCPKCASKASLDMFSKTASGEYRVKSAAFVPDPNFKTIRDMLPRRPQDITLEANDVARLINALEKLEGIFVKFKRALKDI